MKLNNTREKQYEMTSLFGVKSSEPLLKLRSSTKKIFMVGKVVCPCCHKVVSIDIKDIETVVSVLKKCSFCGETLWITPSITFKVEGEHSNQMAEPHKKEHQNIDHLTMEILRIVIESAITSAMPELHFDGDALRFR